MNGKKKHRMKYSQEEEEEAENLGRNKLGRENQQGTIYFTKTTHRNLHICNLYIVDFPFENKFMYVHSARL